METATRGSTVNTGHPCDVTTELDTPSQSSVFIGGQLVATVGDSTVVHNHLVGSCVPHTAAISSGSSTVFIGGSQIARKGDSCDLGSITSGSTTVFVG
jgi:uncharacterized Zn-binding protein involved in type VI secretion